MQQQASRRRHKRHDAGDGLFVNASKSFGKVNNISYGGMAFTYINWHKKTQLEGELDIYLNGKDIVHNIPFTVLSENNVKEEEYTRLVSLKKCRIQFKNLNHRQKLKIKHFVISQNEGE